MRRKLIFAAACLAGLARLAPAQTPDLILNPGSSYVDVGRGIPWGTSFNRAYVIVPNSPNASLCIYVVNNNPTNPHTFTTQTFQAADSQVQDFSNNQGRYNTVPLQNMPASVAASSMGSGFVQSTAAAKVAIKFSASSAAGGSPDTADVFLVQTTSGTCGTAASALPVQGPVAVGTSLGTLNPVIVGGVKGSTNFAEPFGACDQNASNSCAPTGNGLAIPVGANGNSATSVLTGNVATANAGGAPLAVFLTGRANANGNILEAPNISAGTAGSSTVNSPALMVADTGYVKTALVNVTVPSTTPLFSIGAASVGANAFSSCYVQIVVTNTGGTTPTLDVFFQTSGDGTVFNDRIHFAQVTTGTSNQFAGIAASAGITPTTILSGTLTVSTKVDGPIGAWGRFSYVTTGTSPAYSVTYGVSCK